MQDEQKREKIKWKHEFCKPCYYEKIRKGKNKYVKQVMGTECDDCVEFALNSTNK